MIFPWRYLISLACKTCKIQVIWVFVYGIETIIYIQFKRFINQIAYVPFWGQIIYGMVVCILVKDSCFIPRGGKSRGHIT